MRKTCLWIFVFLLIAINVNAGTIRGKVKDTYGDVLPGASIVVEESKNPATGGYRVGTLASSNGNFILSNDIISGEVTVTASFVTQSKTVRLKDGDNYVFVLDLLEEELVEVIGERPEEVIEAPIEELGKIDSFEYKIVDMRFDSVIIGDEDAFFEPQYYNYREFKIFGKKYYVFILGHPSINEDFILSLKASKEFYLDNFDNDFKLNYDPRYDDGSGQCSKIYLRDIKSGRGVKALACKEFDSREAERIINLQLLDKNQIRDGFASIDGKAVPVNLDVVCVDSSTVIPGISAPENLEIESEDWCKDNLGFVENSKCDADGVRCERENDLDIDSILAGLTGSEKISAEIASDALCKGDYEEGLGYEGEPVSGEEIGDSGVEEVKVYRLNGGESPPRTIPNENQFTFGTSFVDFSDGRRVRAYFDFEISYEKIENLDKFRIINYGRAGGREGILAYYNVPFRFLIDGNYETDIPLGIMFGIDEQGELDAEYYVSSEYLPAFNAEDLNKNFEILSARGIEVSDEAGKVLRISSNDVKEGIKKSFEPIVPLKGMSLSEITFGLSLPEAIVYYQDTDGAAKPLRKIFEMRFEARTDTFDVKYAEGETSIHVDKTSFDDILERTSNFNSMDRVNSLRESILYNVPLRLNIGWRPRNIPRFIATLANGQVREGLKTLLDEIPGVEGRHSAIYGEINEKIIQRADKDSFLEVQRFSDGAGKITLLNENYELQNEVLVDEGFVDDVVDYFDDDNFPIVDRIAFKMIREWSLSLGRDEGEEIGLDIDLDELDLALNPPVDTSHIKTNDVLCASYDSSNVASKPTSANSGCEITLGYSDDYLRRGGNVDINEKLFKIHELIKTKFRPLRVDKVGIYLATEEEISSLNESALAFYNPKKNAIYFDDTGDFEQLLYHEFVYAYQNQIERGTYKNIIESQYNDVLMKLVSRTQYPIEFLHASRIVESIPDSSEGALEIIDVKDKIGDFFDFVLERDSHLVDRWLFWYDFIPEYSVFFETLNQCDRLTQVISDEIKWKENSGPISGFYTPLQCENIHEFVAYFLQGIKFGPSIVYKSLQGEFGDREIYQRNLDFALEMEWITREDYDRVVNYGEELGNARTDGESGVTEVSFEELKQLFISSFQVASGMDFSPDELVENFAENFVEKASELCKDCDDEESKIIGVGLLEVYAEAGGDLLGYPKQDLIDAFNVAEPASTFVVPTGETFEEKVARARRELAENGITSEQHTAYKFGISEMLYRGIIPRAYGPFNEGVIKGIIDFFKNIRNRRVEDYPAREDAFRLYLGLPQQNHTFDISHYRPSQSEEDKYYYAFPLLKKILKEKHVELSLSYTKSYTKYYLIIPPVGGQRSDYSLIKDILTAMGTKEDILVADSLIDVMGDFKLSRGQDERGYYLSYYDNWNLEIYEVEGEEGFFGKPFEIYDRIYYDPETFEIIDDNELGCDQRESTLLRRAGKAAAQAIGVGDERPFCPIDMASAKSSSDITTSAILDITGNQVNDALSNVCRIDLDPADEENYEKYAKAIFSRMKGQDYEDNGATKRLYKSIESIEIVLAHIEKNTRLYGNWDIKKLRREFYSLLKLDLDKVLKGISGRYRNQPVIFIAEGRNGAWEIGRIFVLTKTGEPRPTLDSYEFLPAVNERNGRAILKLLRQGEVINSLFITNEDLWEYYDKIKNRKYNDLDGEEGSWNSILNEWNNQYYGLPGHDAGSGADIYLKNNQEYSLIYSMNNPFNGHIGNYERRLMAIIMEARRSGTEDDKERLDSLKCNPLEVMDCREQVNQWVEAGRILIGKK